jgi:hypothetical protein
MLLARRAHAHDLLLVSVLVSEVEFKLSNMHCLSESTFAIYEIHQ